MESGQKDKRGERLGQGKSSSTVSNNVQRGALMAGRITYQQLAEIIQNKMTPDQQQSDVTIVIDEESFAAELEYVKIDDEEDYGLDIFQGPVPILIILKEDVDWTAVYENGKCPDCGSDIPSNTPDGGDCKNCGHVFVVEVDPSIGDLAE